MKQIRIETAKVFPLLAAMRGGLTAEEYRRKLLREFGDD